jgi:hypothetical protein
MLNATNVLWFAEVPAIVAERVSDKIYPFGSSKRDGASFDNNWDFAAGGTNTGPAG